MSYHLLYDDSVARMIIGFSHESSILFLVINVKHDAQTSEDFEEYSTPCVLTASASVEGITALFGATRSIASVSKIVEDSLLKLLLHEIGSGTLDIGRWDWTRQIPMPATFYLVGSP